MKTITFKKDYLKEVAKRAISKLEHAHTYENSDRIKIIFDGTGILDIVVIAQNNYIQNTVTIASIKYVFPNYESAKDIQEAGLDPECENVVREWDWDNFVCSNDFDNSVEYLFGKMYNFLMYEYNNLEKRECEIEVIE